MFSIFQKKTTDMWEKVFMESITLPLSLLFQTTKGYKNQSIENLQPWFPFSFSKNKISYQTFDKSHVKVIFTGFFFQSVNGFWLHRHEGHQAQFWIFNVISFVFTWTVQKRIPIKTQAQSLTFSSCLIIFIDDYHAFFIKQNKFDVRLQLHDFKNPEKTFMLSHINFG